MTLRQTLLLIVITLLAGLGAAVFMHPRGADGVRDLLGFESADTTRALSTGGASDPVFSEREKAASQLQNANEAYDAGNFSGAVTFYSIAAISDDLRQRSEAKRGLQRAVLGWAVVEDTPAPDYGGHTVDDRYAELLARAENEQTEEAWLDVVLFAHGTTRGADVTSAVDTLFEIVKRDGPTEGRLQDVLRNGTRYSKDLAAAMTAIGLDNAAATGGSMIFDDEPEDADEPSGIGGAGKTYTGRYRIPYGDFPKAFRARIADAAKAEAEGLHEAELAGPDGTDRATHRKEAMRLLKHARDVYNEALDEHDPDSVDVQTHLRRVTQVLSLLRKTAAMGE